MFDYPKICEQVPILLSINCYLYPNYQNERKRRLKIAPSLGFINNETKSNHFFPLLHQDPKIIFSQKIKKKINLFWRHWKLQISRTEKLKKKRKKEIKSDIEKKIKLHARQHTTIRLLLGWWCGRHWAYDVIIEHRPQVEKDKGDDWWEWVKYLGREGCWLSPG